MVRVIPFLVVLFILLFGVVAAVETFNSPTVDAVPTPRPTVTPRPRPTSPRPEETALPAPSPTPAPRAQGQPPGATSVPAPPASTPAAQSQLRVGNTGGEGVYIRRTQNMDDRIRPWQDGTVMMVLSQPATVNGVSWVKVRAPDGVEGYIPAQYLVQ